MRSGIHAWQGSFMTGVFFVSAALVAHARDPTPDIINGHVTSQWPGAGAVDVSTGYMCSGIAISTRWVLTAAHCVDPAGVGSASFTFLMGTNINSPDATFTVDQSSYHPLFNSNDLGAGHDVALLHVTSDMPVLAFKLNSTALTPALNGSGALIIGYGVDSSGMNSGIKRTAAVVVSTFDAHIILADYASTSTGTCEGDSGSPLYVYDTDGFPLMLGVASFGDAACDQFSGFGRIDTDMVFVNSVVATGLCMDGQSCDGVLRNGFEAGL